MSTDPAPQMTAEEFFAWRQRPENQANWWELEQGRLVEKRPASDLLRVPYSEVADLVAFHLQAYRDRMQQGYVGRQTGIIINRNPDTVRIPDVVIFEDASYSNTEFVEEWPWLTVEVALPRDPLTTVLRRVQEFLLLGAPLYWVVDPIARSVLVFRPARAFQIFNENDEITGEDVLPGFQCRVGNFFAPPDH